MTHLETSNTSYGQKKSRIALISMCVGGVPHAVEKLSTRLTTLLQTSPQLEVYTQSYGPPKSREP
jgi:hypothetical protein